MNWLIFYVEQCFIPNSYIVTVTFPNFGVDWTNSFSKCFIKMNWLIFYVEQCFIPNSYIVTVTFPNFGVDWANSFQRCRSARLKLLYLFKYLSVWGKVLLSDEHKTKHWSRLIPIKDDMRISLSSTVPIISDILRRKQAQKSHWVTDSLKLFVILKKKEKLKTWLCFPSSKRFAPCFSDMPVRMKLFLEFQQIRRTTS